MRVSIGLVTIIIIIKRFNMSVLKLTKSRQYLLLILGVFVLPVILAKLALNGQWFDMGLTNKGI